MCQALTLNRQDHGRTWHRGLVWGTGLGQLFTNLFKIIHYVNRHSQTSVLLVQSQSQLYI